LVLNYNFGKVFEVTQSQSCTVDLYLPILDDTLSSIDRDQPDHTFHDT